MTPMKAIRLKCIDCSCGNMNEVKLCPMVKCPLYEFRNGKNPNIKREISDEQREIARKRMEALNSAKHTMK